jgi:hypothetical protein
LTFEAKQNPIFVDVDARSSDTEGEVEIGAARKPDVGTRAMPHRSPVCTRGREVRDHMKRCQNLNSARLDTHDEAGATLRTHLNPYNPLEECIIH